MDSSGVTRVGDTRCGKLWCHHNVAFGRRHVVASSSPRSGRDEAVAGSGGAVSPPMWGSHLNIFR